MTSYNKEHKCLSAVCVCVLRKRGGEKKKKKKKFAKSWTIEWTALHLHFAFYFHPRGLELEKTKISDTGFNVPKEILPG